MVGQPGGCPVCSGEGDSDGSKVGQLTELPLEARVAVTGMSHWSKLNLQPAERAESCMQCAEEVVLVPPGCFA